ncbi:methylated-DNA--[protein]-cysteine S-methyltransferase [Halothermothrix orenii]|uniref:Methylated-DNA--protein-cysteine methyltransferase n=1 Tax=Halothermothrix orenii (strain H 168 / OCM 544 / DSM 9562) TaxID=373903 RepID=B8CWA4_HALOH|nr:methylated-DNA--[protein]-cysteine S-methyltransferase [Halothermothrix orenii]ACL69573.1 methylated-DNA--protein-cysteine methyltransferase [Halothermothrix orenii H 168]
MIKNYYPSPLGLMEITLSLDGLVSITFVKNVDNKYKNLYSINFTCKQLYELNKEVYNQLNEYFTGQRRNFNLPLAPAGTDFQKKVWQELLNIPYGETCSYGDIARALGKPGAARAVGRANGKNPLPIVIPCHRVIGSNGELKGYACGLWRKRWLIEHESYYSKQGQYRGLL